MSATEPAITEMDDRELALAASEALGALIALASQDHPLAVLREVASPVRIALDRLASRMVTP